MLIWNAVSFCGNEIQVKLEDSEWYFVLYTHEKIRYQIVRKSNIQLNKYSAFIKYSRITECMLAYGVTDVMQRHLQE
jgi:hypothetical protein